MDLLYRLEDGTLEPVTGADIWCCSGCFKWWGRSNVDWTGSDVGGLRRGWLGGGGGWRWWGGEVRLSLVDDSESSAISVDGDVVSSSYSVADAGAGADIDLCIGCAWWSMRAALLPLKPKKCWERHQIYENQIPQGVCYRKIEIHWKKFK